MKTSDKKINAGTYSIFIGNNALKNLNRFLSQDKYANSKLFILADENTLKHCFSFIKEC